MQKKHLLPTLIAAVSALVFIGCTGQCSTDVKEKSVADRIADRDFPSIFQAWNPIDMEEYPLDTNEQRLMAAAKHDMLWEEPVSQLGFNTDLVLGAIWEGDYGGLSDAIEPESLEKALDNRKKMLAMNPNMIFLMEVRWRDAPGSFLPEDSEFWMREPDGTRTQGWMGGPEPYYKMNPENAAWQDYIARQSKIAIDSGIYDGVMLDWSGHLEIIKKVRAAIGPEPLIIVNIHDDIEDGELYQDYINGSFMEQNIQGCGATSTSNQRTWERTREALVWFENHLQEPRINGLENWGNRDDLQRMRATTTLGLTHSNGYVLYGDPNPLPEPDHLHDWYDFWDAELGTPTGDVVDRDDGSYQREFTGGTVLYNPYQNDPVTITFDEDRTRCSDGSVAQSFTIQGCDGDIFLKIGE